jgi:hypothetical protein
MVNLHGADTVPQGHPLEMYFKSRYQPPGRDDRDARDAVLGSAGWSTVGPRGGMARGYRKYRKWERLLVRDIDQMRGQGRLSWSVIAGLSRGILTLTQARGRRTNTQLTLPLILRQPISRRGTRAIQTTV